MTVDHEIAAYDRAALKKPAEFPTCEEGEVQETGEA
jgi:hypothetical protein